MTHVNEWVADCDYQDIMKVLEKNDADFYELFRVVAENLEDLCYAEGWKY